jgi:hypothetical protein
LKALEARRLLSFSAPDHEWRRGFEPGHRGFNSEGWIDLVVVNSPSSGKTTFSVLFNDKNC